MRVFEKVVEDDRKEELRSEFNKSRVSFQSKRFGFIKNKFAAPSVRDDGDYGSLFKGGGIKYDENISPRISI